jgi:hypothetical protein
MYVTVHTCIICLHYTHTILCFVFNSYNFLLLCIAVSVLFINGLFDDAVSNLYLLVVK